MSSDDGQERNQKATPQRMKDVRKKGGLGRSKDLSGWLAMGAAVLMAPSVATATRHETETMIHQVAAVAADPSPAAALTMLDEALSAFIGIMAPLFAVLVVVVLLAQISQGGVHPRMKLHTESLNPGKGIKRLVGTQTLWELVKTLAKALAVGFVVYAVLQGLIPALMGSGRLRMSAVLALAGSSVTSVLRAGVLAGLALAVLDLVVVIRRNRKKTRMTLKEVKDENKRTEGDPHMKGAIRSRQQKMSRNRMMAAVANADVVVVNPTHVAVALRYQPGHGAPSVLAKGIDALAARIREEAARHRVPMVSDVPLARALYAACEVDQEIPEYLFMAVARVLAFVMSLRRRGAAAGEHRSPGGTSLPEYIDADHHAVARAQKRSVRVTRQLSSTVVTPKATTSGRSTPDTLEVS